MDENTYALSELVEDFGLMEDDLRRAAKRHLIYNRDYFNAGRAGMRLRQSGVDKLRDEIKPQRNALFCADSSESIMATVHRILPPNPRFLWIVGDGIEGRGVCHVPARLSKLYRVAGKRLRVRHVDGNVYQIVLKVL
jgi:hypothetical protein